MSKTGNQKRNTIEKGAVMNKKKRGPRFTPSITFQDKARDIETPIYPPVHMATRQNFLIAKPIAVNDSRCNLNVGKR